MIDLHSHFLPNIDDGSKSPEESVQMLKTAWAQGVKVMAATPHFYPDREMPQAFLQKRQCALERIPYEQTAMPEILLGAELAYFDGLSRSEEMQKLRIGESPLLLVEMPFSPWTERMVGEICALRKNLELVPVLAHVERYFRFFSNSDVLKRLRDEGVCFQSNSEFFLSPFRRRRAIKMLRNGQIHFLGSDCHGTEQRTPNLGAAVDKILRAGAAQSYREMELWAYSLLEWKETATGS